MNDRIKILVLGGAGMLGHKMFQVLRERFAGVICTVRDDVSRARLESVAWLQSDDVISGVDVAADPELAAILKEVRPEYVVNCAGVIKQRPQAQQPIPSLLVNALLPHRLCETVAGWGGRVIHFSTDCVFNGEKGAYREDDLPDAEDLYGRTKFLGEVSGPNALTLRTSIIGRELAHHISLLDWFLAQNHGRVRGFQKMIFSGVTANYLAETVADIIERAPRLSGLYHLASEPIAKFHLLHLLRDAYRLNIEIEAVDGCVCDRSLVGTRFVEATGLVCPDWLTLVHRLAEDPTPYPAPRSSPSSGNGTPVRRGPPPRAAVAAKAIR